MNDDLSLILQIAHLKAKRTGIRYTIFNIISTTLCT